MGFFKDFKDDFSQALSELMPGDDSIEVEEAENEAVEESLMINTIDDGLDVEAELNKLDGLLMKVEEKVNKAETAESVPEAPARVEEIELPELKILEFSHDDEKAAVSEALEEALGEAPSAEEVVAEEIVAEEPELTAEETVSEVTPEPVPEVKAEPVPEVMPEPVVETQPEPVIEKAIEPVKEDIKIEKEIPVKPEAVEEIKMDTFETKVAEPVAAEADAFAEETAVIAEEVKTDEVTIITEGTALTGNIQTCGSIEVKGKITGDIKCAGKLTVTGYINGNSASEEFFADTAFVEGEVVSTGTVKIGLGSRIIGNISSTSAVIAGAVKGDIDVHGPVVVDSSAVILGNIKSKSVQINNGAVIEGFCSQCYSDVNVEDLFSEKE